MSTGVDDATHEPDVQRIEIVGEFDAQGLEALQLEIRRLAKLHDVKIKTLRAEKVARP